LDRTVAPIFSFFAFPQHKPELQVSSLRFPFLVYETFAALADFPSPSIRIRRASPSASFTILGGPPYNRYGWMAFLLTGRSASETYLPASPTPPLSPEGVRGNWPTFLERGEAAKAWSVIGGHRQSRFRCKGPFSRALFSGNLLEGGGLWWFFYIGLGDPPLLRRWTTQDLPLAYKDCSHNSSVDPAFVALGIDFAGRPHSTAPKISFWKVSFFAPFLRDRP